MIALLISERAKDLQLFRMVSPRRGERLLAGFWRKKPQHDKCQTKHEQILESCVATHIFTPADTIWVGVYKNQHDSLKASPQASHT